MEVTITCPCGAKFTRNEGSAGVKIRCACGQDIQVPTFAEMRSIRGEPEDPERLIRAGIDDKKLFPDRACCRCRCRTEFWVPVMIECEPGNFDAGGFDWKPLLGAIFLTIVFPPLGVWAVGKVLRYSIFVTGASSGSYGKAYRVPLLACPECQKRLDNDTLIQCVRSVPVYDRLLNKYPEARVEMVTRQG